MSSNSWQRELIKRIYCILNSGVTPRKIIAEILSNVGERYQIDSVVLLSIESSVGQIYNSWTADKKKSTPIVFDQEWIQLLRCVTQCQAYLFCQVRSFVPHSLDNYFFQKSHNYSCIASFPLYIQENFFGYLILQTQETNRTFSQEDIETLEIITHQIATILKQIKLQEKLEQIELENEYLNSCNQNKSDYLSHMNHELRTPLSGILGFSKMLKEELYGPLNDKQKQYINGIRVSGEHLLALVNDFLDLSKIEANKEEIFLETVAVEDICLAAISIVQVKAKEQKLELILDIGDDIDFCTVDQRRIKQILLNLLSNAIKFTEKGSVILRVKRCQKYLTFCVIDTGIGLKESDQEKLFQPFQQIQNHLSRKHKGTGLGLALSRKLAQLHGGDLTLTSEYGKGSCFTLELPIN
ncbi:MAG: HAMP domain-containing sensor histidine kinase [Cyanobacteria bacterium P01_G01_bin.49]